MNGPGDIPLTLSSTPETKTCSLTFIIPTLGMSSCRGRAEAFARSLSSKLRTLGSQTEDEVNSQEDEPIINGGVSVNTWRTSHDSEQQTVTDLQPLRHESDSFFDFDCELESPGSPVDECEYLRLIETASNTPHNSAAESGYVCASAASSHSSTDGPFFDVVSNDNPIATQPAARNSTLAKDFVDYENSGKVNGDTLDTEKLYNGHEEQIPSTERKQTACQIENEANLCSNNHSDKASTLPIDITNTEFKEIQSDGSEIVMESNEQELSEKDMVEMQDQIINELRQHSESVGSLTAASAESSESSVSAEEKSEEVPKEPSQSIHAITNGHNEDGEETLQIEVQSPTEEIEEKITQVHQNEDKQEKDISESEPVETKIEQAEQDEDDESTSKSKTEKGTAKHSGMDITDDDEEDDRPQRVRRCSSLKTGKTPPGTPGRKKIVRFADVLGLDLADVKTFLDEIPTIPKSAFEDLEIMEAEPPIQLGPKSDKLLMPLFQQPGGLSTFLDLVREKQVNLENAAVTDTINQTITGSVRVRNLDFHKSVHIRYSLDHWRSFADLQANYVENSCDGFSDKFTFVLFGNSLHIGQRLEFAVRFQCKGQQYWDNNYGANYCFQCLPSSSAVTNPLPPIVSSHHTNNLTGLMSPTVSDAWCSSFY